MAAGQDVQDDDPLLSESDSGGHGVQDDELFICGIVPCGQSKHSFPSRSKFFNSWCAL